MINTKKIGAKVKLYRKGKCYTQAQLAEKVDISTIHMSHIETGSVSMSVELLIKICSCLNITPDQVLLGSYETGDNETLKQLDFIVKDLSKEDRQLLIDFALLLKDREINNK